LRIPSKSFEILMRKNIKNSPHTLSQLLPTKRKWRCQSKTISWNNFAEIKTKHINFLAPQKNIDFRDWDFFFWVW
jgi:hypothetical protein